MDIVIQQPKMLLGMVTIAPLCFTTILSAAKSPRRRQQQQPSSNRQSGSNSTTSTKNTTKIGFGSKKREPLWQCAHNCGACCKLDKGPAFPSPEEIFDDPSDLELFNSLVGPDGWCVHYDKATRKCSIYADRPYFCRVEPDVFETLYGIEKKKFNKEACGSCIDTIKAVYGSGSKELENFNNAIWGTCSK